MNLDETRRWLEDRTRSIWSSMDYNPTYRNADVNHDMRSWLNNPDWDDGTFAFEALGFDGTGGRFLALDRGDGGHAVAFMGSEGSRGVLVPDLKCWMQVIAYAPMVREASLESRRAYLSVVEGRTAHSSYRTGVEKLFGPLPEFSALVEGVEELDERFREWVAARLLVFSLPDLRRAGLQGGAGAGAKRRAVCALLGYGSLNAKALMKALNADGVSLEEFHDAVRRVESEQA